MQIKRLVGLFLTAAALSLQVAGSPRAQEVSLAISVGVAPPPLPVYDEPPLPADGYIFIPGYWAWGDGGYYWVPGTWVLPPQPGLLWTPGYWAFNGQVYAWTPGYWGPQVGYYGGIDYGFGYFGVGYSGGRWQDGHFFYNSAVHNFGHVRVADSYRAPPPAPISPPRVSWTGGIGGTAVRPRPEDQAASRLPHAPPSAPQQQHEAKAGNNFSSLMQANHGRPPIAATPKPATFTGPGIVSARPGNAAAASPAARPTAAPARAAPGASPSSVQRPAPAGHSAPRANPGGAAPMPRRDQ